MEKRNVCVDSMKGLAIIGVLLIHINSIEKAYPYLPIVNKFASIGARGVQIFFMISAFLIFNSLHRFEMKKKNNGISNWYLQKIIRLIPVYYISNILWLILVIRGGYSQFDYWTGSHGVTIPAVITNFLFLHGFYPWHINAININWYVGTLVIYILLSPILYKALNSLEKSVTAFVVAMFLSQIVIKLSGMVNFGDDNYIWNTYWGNFSFIAQFPIFILGIVLYHLCNTLSLTDIIRNFYSNHAGLKSLKLLSYASTIGILMILVIFLNSQDNLILFAIMFAGLFFINMVYPTKMVCNTVFSHLGKYSYGIYLFHYIIINIIIMYMNSGKITSTCYRELLFTIILLFSYGLSVLCNVFIEKPLQKLNFTSNKSS